MTLTLALTFMLPQLANEEKISRIEMLMDPSGGALPFKGAVSLNRWASISDLFLSSEDHHHLIAVQTWPYIIWSSGVLTKTKNLNTLHKFSWVGRCILYTIYTTVKYTYFYGLKLEPWKFNDSLSDWRWETGKHQETLNQDEKVHWKHNHVRNSDL